MKKSLEPVPTFADETAERAFWEAPDADSTRHVDWSQAARVTFPELRPSTQAISIRLPVSLLDRIKAEAHRRDVPYQSLIKVWLAEKVDR